MNPPESDPTGVPEGGTAAGALADGKETGDENTGAACAGFESSAWNRRVNSPTDCVSAAGAGTCAAGAGIDPGELADASTDGDLPVAEDEENTGPATDELSLAEATAPNAPVNPSLTPSGELIDGEPDSDRCGGADFPESPSAPNISVNPPGDGAIGEAFGGMASAGGEVTPTELATAGEADASWVSARSS